ncbi:hypothetical protein [Novosphingobium sp. 9U]|uniref:hypothetical protein n=1 Tax=Novosphingobium sp. 9U TaxID=2653158 RepID=UPI0012F03E47|nr:hypothetical protein [Novosphingobium sp. 9U]VWX50901.1 conserved hypothetical protein [Novosphingobium sp. 9U]
MSSVPFAPRLIKGALVGLDPMNPLASVVVFQYNPDTMTRRLEPRTAGGQPGDKGEAYRLSGPPKETITLAVEIDATDAMEEGDPQAGLMGIGPTLAALEMMLYPKLATVIANTVLSVAGVIEILPATGPMVLFVWGPTRVLPVRVTALSITEDAYDTLLNPIRAKVDLTLEVLSYYDQPLTSPGRALFLAHQAVKEVLAVTNIANDLGNLGVSL